jgi:type II secretory ATPase GspE/PulE/Tfp pilus assembly ATPase PilB-like protein
MVAKILILKDINLGQRVAEEEADDLQKYFVKTAHWERLAEGNVDVVYGPKGSGKSALYTSLVQQAQSFEKRKIIVVTAENPRGQPYLSQ